MEGNKMKKGIILLVFICTSLLGNAQSGYLGDLNSVEFKIGLTPSIFRKNRVVDITQNEDAMFSTLRLALPSYQLNVARTVSRRVELSLGFEFAAMNLFAESVRYENNTSYIMLENLKANRFGANFEFRFYRKGCFSPIGKYAGFSINMGKARVKTSDGLVYGSTGNQLSGSGSFLTRKREINLSETSFDFSREESTYTALRFVIGRNYPLGNRLSLNFGMSAPLLSYYNSGFGGQNGIRLLSPPTIRIINGDLEKSLRYTMHKYNRIRLSISIKKYF